MVGKQDESKEGGSTSQDEGGVYLKYLRLLSDQERSALVAVAEGKPKETGRFMFFIFDEAEPIPDTVFSQFNNLELDPTMFDMPKLRRWF